MLKMHTVMTCYTNMKCALRFGLSCGVSWTQKLRIQLNILENIQLQVYFLVCIFFFHIQISNTHYYDKL